MLSTVTFTLALNLAGGIAAHASPICIVLVPFATDGATGELVVSSFEKEIVDGMQGSRNLQVQISRMYGASRPNAASPAAAMKNALGASQDAGAAYLLSGFVENQGQGASVFVALSDVNTGKVVSAVRSEAGASVDAVWLKKAADALTGSLVAHN